MEVQMAAQGTKSTGTSSGGGGVTANKPVPGYMRPSAGSCHHVCKYGGTHTFDDHNHNHKEPHSSRPQPRPPRKQPHAPPPAPAPAESHKQNHGHNRVLVKVRSVFRRRVADSNSTTAAHKPSKAAAAAAGKSGKAANAIAKVGDGVEWKDIAAYDTVPPPPHGSSNSSDVKKMDAIKEKKKKKKKKKPYGNGKVVHEQQVVDGGVEEVGRQDDEALDTKATDTDSNKSIKPQQGKKNKPTALLVENVAELLQIEGYQILSPTLAQSRANLLRDLEKEMLAQQEQEQEQEQEAAATTTNLKEQQTRATSAHGLDPEDYAAAAESSRPIPTHRRVQSMSMGMSGMSSSRSVRHAFGRQTSRNSSGAVFKVRSRSTRAPPPAAAVVIGEEKEERPPARLRSRRGSIGGGEDSSSSSAGTGRGIHLRIRSLRRRGVGGSGGAGTGFVVPAVALRHQKTLDKKKSQRLYNNLIEETASNLVKTRKSRVKALVGAFESVISKIAK